MGRAQLHADAWAFASHDATEAGGRQQDRQR